MRGDFLNVTRLTAWSRILAAAIAVFATVYVVKTILHSGSPDADLGIDFTCYWAAGQMALHGMAAAVYQPEALSAAQHAARALPPNSFFPFYYPPPYLLLCAVLALLPYWVALALFVFGSLTLLLLALRPLLPQRMGFLPALTFPGVLVTGGTAQNGFLSASCFAGFAVLADARPILAGACLGALACKPQLAACAPIALIFAGRGRCLFAAAATFGLLCLASLAAFGTAPWLAFLQHAGAASGTIAGGMLDEGKIMSSFIAARLLGAGFWVAGIVQGLVAAAVLATLFLRRAAPAHQAGAVLAAASLLATPYLADYDLACMLPALAVGVSLGVRGGFLPGDKPLLLAAYMMPLLAHGVALKTGVQLAPLGIAMLLYVLVRPRNATALATAS